MAEFDEFVGHMKGLDSPYDKGADVTPHDTNLLPFRTRALWVGGTGAVAVQWPDGTSTVFPAVPAGHELRVRVDKVLATGTTATNIRALK